MLKTLLFILLSVSLSLAGRAQSLSEQPCPGCWNPDSLGNHRVVVRWNGPGAVAHAHFPWRLRIADPAEHRIIVQDERTGSRVMNASAGKLTRESGEVFFEPVSGKGLYCVYYLPYRNEGRSNYPKGVYLRADTTASAPWKAALNRAAPVNCSVTAYQSIDSFNLWSPMEVIATAKETAALKKKYAAYPYLVFPEDREHPLRMRNELPSRWIGKGPGGEVSGAAARGEWFAYQLGLYALKDLRNVQVEFGELRNDAGAVIPAANSSCINTGGTAYDGRPFTKDVSVASGEVQALWCGIDIPRDVAPGIYTGDVTILALDSPQNYEKEVFAGTVIHVRIRVGDSVVADGGAGHPEKMTRLRWLNSTLAQENTVIAPYTPLTVSGDTLIGLLGRDIRLTPQGFPEQIRTFFTPEMTSIGATPAKLLAENIHFHFTRAADGKDIRMKPSGVHFTEKSPGTVRWEANSSADELRMEVNASLEFDGFLAYAVKVTALQDLDLKDITMHIPFDSTSAVYLMGLGRKGGYRPDSMVHWKWDVPHKNQDGAWIGTVNAGLQYSLRDERYVRPLNTNFYLQKPLIAPSSWDNAGNGGIDIGIKGKSMLANNYSGQRQMKKGDTLYYDFNLLITPFHPLNTDAQWATRFYHKYDDPRAIAATGATVINIHHATPINPWINYPFIEWRRMKGYIDTAHALGLKVKIYNTVRELSDHAYELFALRSLGHEIYSTGPGGGFSWLQEHLGDDYIPAWFVPEIRDAAVINSGMSRWHNYYVEGMNWLVQNVGIDGIYLDDVAFDRVTMKRIKRVLTQDGHPGIIDLHSANQYNPRDGYNNSANLYMEHFPYLNRLWFGEYFDYEHNPPDFFLTEVSGIPFGLMGEMLQGGGNPWRGMVFGMTNRMPWSDNADPRPIWKAWDAFGMEGTQMIGYWSPSCPVRTGREDIPATVYQKKGAALIALASWASGDTVIRLNIDWQRLGIDPAQATIEAPAIANFQPGRHFSPGEAIPVAKGKGWMLIIRGSPGAAQ
jgi:hypothetical protein